MCLIGVGSVVFWSPEPILLGGPGGVYSSLMGIDRPFFMTCGVVHERGLSDAVCSFDGYVLFGKLSWWFDARLI